VELVWLKSAFVACWSCLFDRAKIFLLGDFLNLAVLCDVKILNIIVIEANGRRLALLALLIVVAYVGIQTLHFEVPVKRVSCQGIIIVGGLSWKFKVIFSVIAV